MESTSLITTQSLPSSPNPSKRNLWKIIALLLLIIFVIDLIDLAYIFRSNTVSSTQTQDPKIEQDLASISIAVESYTGPNEGSPGDEHYEPPYLPSTLSQLHLKLNYDISSYPYKILEDDGGEQNETAIYEICADFNTNTFSVAAYNNQYSSSPIDSTLSSSYSIHTIGEQCFTNTMSTEVNGLDMIFNSYESKYQDQLSPLPNADWPTDFHTPVDLSQADRGIVRYAVGAVVVIILLGFGALFRIVKIQHG